MVSQKSIAAQLKKIGFKQHGWGKGEVQELQNIIIPDEEIFECVNGIYEGGFALLVATDVRVLLIDKKPFNFLTVEDLRFDMINEIDYSHRMFGAYVDISTGSRDLTFRSYNQVRLRKLIGHVQHCMAEAKKKEATHQEDQNQHLEQINERLQAYLIAQHQHQEELQNQLREAQRGGAPIASPEAPRPSPELSDYLLAQSLMAQQRQAEGSLPAEPAAASAAPAMSSGDEGLYADGVREVFGNYPLASDGVASAVKAPHNLPEVNAALRIAYSKLPTVLRSRRFGHVSLHHPSLPLHHVPAAVQPEPAAQPQATS